MVRILCNQALKLIACYKTSGAQNGEFGGFSVDSYYTLQGGVEGGKLIFERSSAKQIFTQKSNTRQTERLMLLLVAFNQRSIENPSVNCQITFEKCSFRSDKHPCAKNNNHAVCFILIGCIL